MARFSNAQVIGYKHEWARGKLYLFGLPGIAVPGGLLDFLPELGPWRGWKEERARAWNLGGPLIFVGIKKQYNILDKHAYTYTHKHGNQQETINTKGFLCQTAHRVCAWLCT